MHLLIYRDVPADQVRAGDRIVHGDDPRPMTVEEIHVHLSGETLFMCRRLRSKGNRRVVVRTHEDALIRVFPSVDQEQQAWVVLQSACTWATNAWNRHEREAGAPDDIDQTAAPWDTQDDAIILLVDNQVFTIESDAVPGDLIDAEIVDEDDDGPHDPAAAVG